MDNNLKGEEFLDRLYKGLHMSDEVIHTAENKDSKAEKINRYMERLERVNKRANKRDSSMRNLKYLYHRKYVIKKENLPKNVSDDDKDRIINAQIESMDKWLDYLLDTNAPYPTWAKYWAFQGMLKIGTYDEANDVYQKRSKKTIAPFIEADPEIIAKCIDFVTKYVNSEKIDDKDLEKLIASGNFTKLYTLFIKNKKDNVLRTDNINDGKWITYYYETEEDIKRKKEQGITPEYKKLYNSLQGYNTHWCTAGSEDTAKSQICGDDYCYEGGDFHVYYTKDENGDYKIPRLAIRMDKNDIGEIRGVADESQNVEEGFEEIIKEKIKTFKNINHENLEYYIKIINDTKKLTLLNKKNTRKEKLTEEDIIFIYELDNKIESFGWDGDARINKIISTRKIRDDYESLRNKENKIKFILNYSENNQSKEISNFIVSIDDKDIILEIIEHYNDRLPILKYANEKIKKDKKIISIATGIDYTNLEYAADSLKKDKEFILEQIEKIEVGLRYAADSLKKDKEFVLEAIKKNAVSIFYIDESLKKDRDVILTAVKLDGIALCQADLSLVNDKEIVLAAVSNNGSAIKYVGEKLRKDKEVVLTAVSNYGYGLRFIHDKSMRKDKDVVLAAVSNNLYALGYADKSLLNDKEFMAEVEKIKEQQEEENERRKHR